MRLKVRLAQTKKFTIFLLYSGSAEDVASQMSLEFKVFLINAVTKKHTLESRILRFWFKEEFPVSDRAKLCQEFFKELVSPSEFPRGWSLAIIFFLVFAAGCHAFSLGSGCKLESCAPRLRRVHHEKHEDVAGSLLRDSQN